MAKAVTFLARQDSQGLTGATLMDEELVVRVAKG